MVNSRQQELFDENQSASSVEQQATGETVPEPVNEKKKAAQESGRRGGLIGGAVRSSKLTSEKGQRSLRKRLLSLGLNPDAFISLVIE